MVKVQLNANEFLTAANIGMRRNAEAIFKGRKARFPEKTPGELWGFHIESSIAEMCVAKHLGIYWTMGVNTFHIADIGKNFEVRWSMREDCKVRPDDNDVIIVSVHGTGMIKSIMGWIYSEDAKKEEYEFKGKNSDLAPCYFVPHHKLMPIDELKNKFIQ
jgi:hypothetical protein